jgi:cell division transport system permease protein
MILLRTTYQHLRRSPYLTLAAAIIMSLTFLSTGIFILVALGAHATLRHFEAQPRVIAFFDEELPSDRIRQIKNKLEGTGDLAFFNYVTKEQAFERYKGFVEGEPELQEFVSPEILVSSIEISADRAESLTRLAEMLRSEEGVTDFAFQEELIESLIYRMRFVRVIGAVLVGFLIADLVLITLMFIGLRIRMKREEISTMRLLGATSGYIRAPFILEGIFYGLVGAVVAWGVIYLLLWTAKPYLSAFLTDVQFFPLPTSFMLVFLAGMTLSGVIIGVLGSTLAVLRYLRE